MGLHTINELITYGKSLDITYKKSSIISTFKDTEYIVKNIFYDYIDELKDNSIMVTLDNKEFHFYKERPRLLADKLYNNGDLYFIILLLNDMFNEKEFDRKSFLVLHPKNISILSDIMNAESNYLNSDTIYFSDANEQTGSSNSTNSGSDEVDSAIYEDIADIKAKLEQINNTIKESVNDIVSGTIDEILINTLDERLTKIYEELNGIVDDTIQIRIKELRDEMEKMRIDIDKKVDIEIDYIYKELYEIRQLIKDNIIKYEQNSKDIVDIKEKIESIESSITSIGDLITIVVDSKLDSRLDLLNKRITDLEELNLPVDIVNQLNSLKTQVTEISNSIEPLLSDNYNKIMSEIETMFTDFKTELDNVIGPTIEEELNKMKDKILAIADITKDITFMIMSPIDIGIQEETEFRIPYKGDILKASVAVGVESKRTSNLLLSLQRYDEFNKVWDKLTDINLTADKQYDEFDINIPIDYHSIRICVDGGDMNSIKSINMVFKLKQFIEEQ